MIKKISTEPNMLIQQHIKPNASQKKYYLPSLAQQCAQRLNAYISQIDLQLDRHHNHFDYGFTFFKYTQGQDRLINYHLAKTLVDKLSTSTNENESYALFSDEALEEARQQIIKKLNIKPGFFASNSIHSTTLNGIIRQIKSDIVSYLTACRLSMRRSIKDYQFDTIRI